ncbi:MAG: hypothetical protein VX804_03700 [Candidatus Thermoplasmatota archaeon]|nr:hypothetical protein [Candidatus Thermoplasmatota archaeon]
MERRTDINTDPKNDKSVVEMLPELSEQELTKATHEDCIAWVSSIVKLPIGDTWLHDDDEENSTFNLFQTISSDTIRCIRVFDHESSYWFISMMQASCDAAGITLELGSYTVISAVKEFISFLQKEIEEQTGLGLHSEYDEELFRGWE